MASTPSIHKTGDGSTTLYSPLFDQHYHNPNGAVAESRHVYFETPGIPDAVSDKSGISILEVGFGTGLNLILLLDYLHKAGLQYPVFFQSIEAFPLDIKTASHLHFGDEIKYLQPGRILTDIFSDLKKGHNRISVSNSVTLDLFIGFFDDMTIFNSPVRQFDFILHDPFSPDVNPDLWTPGVFKKLASAGSDNAVLATYCAASSARAAMAVAGWKVARAPGALGKREMTVASLNPEKLTSFKRVNEKRLIERYHKEDFK